MGNLPNDLTGVLNDTYGGFVAAGQKFYGWTSDAFNPVSYGTQQRTLPVSAPELLSGGDLNPSNMAQGGGLMANMPTWSILKSPVPWILVGALLLIPLYHHFEYGFGKKK